MKQVYWRFIAGSMLLLFGILALMENFNVIHLVGSFWGLLVALIFFGGGLAFLSVVLANRLNWWGFIPGVTLLGLSAIIAIPLLLPAFPGQWLGAIFLAAIGLSFWLVYLISPANWWAIIPGGTLFTLAGIAGMSNQGGLVTGSLLFFGLALTFALVALLPAHGRHMAWAWIPSGILLAFGALISFNTVAWSVYIWPIVLILVGGFLILRPNLHRR